MKRPCFTLVELLVVIATIALLMAILVPVLRSSRLRAKSILCASNIKQLLVGLMMYENENQILPHSFHGSDTPPSCGYPGNRKYDRPGWWWFNYIGDYLAEDCAKVSVLWCPARQINDPELKGDVLCGNYGVNQSICKKSRGRRDREEFIGPPLRSGNISRAGETLLVVDSGYSMINWWHVTDILSSTLRSRLIEDTAYIPGLEINNERDLLVGQLQDAINGRHPNKTVNVGFVDGHISRTKADSLLVDETADGYKNRSPLWAPK